MIEAFAASDEGRIEQILQEWVSRPDAVRGEGVALELVRLIRRLAQGRKRLADVQDQIEKLAASGWNRLRQNAEASSNGWEGFFLEVAAGLETRIQDARRRLHRITGKHSFRS